MNIPELQACLASAVRYIQNHAGIEAAPYFDEIPENYIVPSMYFPVPRTESHKVTLSSWRTDITLECWFAAATDWEAFRYADSVRDSILADGCAIDIMNRDGSLSGSKVRVSEPNIRKQESRVVRMSFVIREYFKMEKEKGIPAVKYQFSGLIPAGAAYDAWYAATVEQRREEEEQKECLRKAMENL